MEAQDIERYLADLGQELQQRGVRQPIRLLVVGGAFMLTQLHNRPSTNDIDVLFKELAPSSTSPIYRAFKAATRAVARRHALPGNWLNDLISDFLRGTGTAPEGTLWRTFTPLELYIPEAEYILALKLFAGRPKDRDDITVLCQRLQVLTRAQAQQLVDRYIPDRQLQQLNHLDETLDDFFP